MDLTLSLIEKITSSFKQSLAPLEKFKGKGREAFSQIKNGVDGLKGLGNDLQGVLAPAIQMFNAMQDASTRGISDNALALISQQALDFSIKYGTSADKYVKSSAQIRTAIDGLDDGGLAKVTNVANLMNKALGATTEETTNFYRQMFSNFRAEADAAGHVQFAEQLAGKMAYMRGAFGVGLNDVTTMMKDAKSAGSNFGVSLNEQLAVIGDLYSSLGAGSGNAYQDFLSNAAKGAEKLGLSFTDANGSLLSMPQMLQALQDKYGTSIDGNLKAQVELDAAFGNGAGVIKQLYGHIDALQGHINALGSNKGMAQLQSMAEKLTSPWERLSAVWNVISIAVGLTMLPVLYQFLNTLADGGQQMADWMKMFPIIARLVGYAALVVTAFMAVGSAVNIVMGAGRLVILGVQAAWWALTAVTKIYTGAIWLAQQAMMIWNVTLRAIRGVLLAVRIAAVLAGVSINFMSWPILLIIGAVALLAAGFYLLITHWNDIKAAVMNTSAFQYLMSYISYLGNVFTTIWSGIAAGWQWLCQQFQGVSPLQGLTNIASSIGTLFSKLWGTIKNTFSSTYNWIVDKLNVLPGINIKATAIPNSPPPSPPPPPTALTGGQVASVGSGGGINPNNSYPGVTDNSRHIGSVTIYVNNGMTPGQLREWQELQA